MVGPGTDTLGAAHIAARLGLETTGITLPITKRDEKVKEPGNEPSPILVGRHNALVEQLAEDWQDSPRRPAGRRRGRADRAEGVRQRHRDGRGRRDAAGIDGGVRSTSRGGRRTSGIRTAGRWSLDDLSSEVTKFLSAKSGAGQAGQVLRELREVLEELKGKTIESFDAKLYLEKGNAGFDKFLAAEIGTALGKTSKVTVASQGVTDASTVFEEKTDVPWEVDEFWAKFRADVLPKVKAGAKVEIEARLSEPAEVRSSIVEQARSELKKAGAAEASVRVLSAYKQGFSWLTEQIIPALKGKGVRSVRMRIATHKPDLSKKYKFYSMPTRWLHELYPVDEIFKRDLGIPTGAFRMELVDEAKEIYALEAMDASGRSVMQGDLQPEVRRARVPRQVPGLVARRGDDRMADGEGGRPGTAWTRASRRTPSASGTTTRPRCCRGSTTT